MNAGLTASTRSLLLVLALILLTSCRADSTQEKDATQVEDDSSVELDSTTDMKNSDISSRALIDLMQDLMPNFPLAKVFNVGLKTLSAARTFTWPAGLASLVIGTAPTTGAIVGIISISIFVIVIWLIIYSIGVLPVGSALDSRFDPQALDGSFPSLDPMARLPEQILNSPYPYNERFQRSLAQASKNVMDAMDEFQLKQNNK